MNTIQITIHALEALQQVLIAELSAIGYDAFEEKENTLEAFITEENFDEQQLTNTLDAYKTGFQKSLVSAQNWNALWESNFPPVVVGDFCMIRAHFHQPVAGVQHDLLITPKMSFGTGHHATTYMMVSQMKDIDFTNKSVADFGTGTGILAILAEKLGSKDVWAIDNDDWSIDNAAENIEQNNCRHILLQKAQRFTPGGTFDVILANINRNVILENAAHIAAAMKPSSKLLLSGLLAGDEADITTPFQRHNVTVINTVHRHNWISMLLGIL